MKYVDYFITFQEVPDEVSLVFTIPNCQYRCKGCHSPWLADDVGKDIASVLTDLLHKYKDSVTCVCFMGEGNSPGELALAMMMCRKHGYKVCLYSGGSVFDDVKSLEYFKPDYLKIGPYIEELGGLDNPMTNQRFYELRDNNYFDITFKFWRKGMEFING